MSIPHKKTFFLITLRSKLKEKEIKREKDQNCNKAEQNLENL